MIDRAAMPGTSKIDDWPLTYWKARAEKAEAALASRPQEQPRKATGEIEQAKSVLSDMAARLVWSNDMAFRDRIKSAIDALARLSVSPVAAQGWQMVPKIATEEMLSAAAQAPDDDDWIGAMAKAWRAMLAAAPPLPAAQEQEKGVTHTAEPSK